MTITREFRRVLKVVGRAFDLDPDILTSATQLGGRVHLARCFVLYLARVVYEIPSAHISRMFPRRPKAIAVSCRAVEDYRITPEFDALLDRLEKELIDEEDNEGEQDSLRDDARRGVHAPS